MALERIGPLGLEITGFRSDGRRRYEAASKERLIEACLRPGVSVSRLALDHGVNTNLVRKWIAARRQAAASSAIPVLADSAFVRVVADTVTAMPESAAPGGELAIPCPAVAQATGVPVRVEASLPNGARVLLDGCDAHLLAVMIGALGRCDVPAVG
jgi:transposase